jgi:hypothetical protein
MRGESTVTTNGLVPPRTGRGAEFRSQVLEFLSSDSDERNDLLSRFEPDERRVFLFHFYHVTLAEKYDSNSLPALPFTKREMQRLYTSAGHKFVNWMLDGIKAGRSLGLMDGENRDHPSDPS